MKKMLVMLFFSFISLTSFAPSANFLSIEVSEPIKAIEVSDYEPLINAITWYESGNNDTIVNKVEGAVGRFQIRECRLQHYNTLTGKQYSMEDMKDYFKAREIFLYFTCHDGAGRPIPPKTWEMTAKNWNGSGPLTIKYWDAVKVLI